MNSSNYFIILDNTFRIIVPGSKPDPFDNSQEVPVDYTADSLSLLGNETRLKILSTLHDASAQTRMDFSTLYQQVDAKYSSGFNYHLDKLIPRFVTKDDDAYRLTAFGKRVARAVAAGTFSANYKFGPIKLNGACLICGEEELNASYNGDMFTVECDECGEVVIHIQVPPNLAQGRDVDSFIDAVDRWLHQWMQMSISLVSHGICEHCGSSVDVSIADDIKLYDRLDVLVRFKCSHCGEVKRSTIGAVASQNPKVQQFYFSRGTPIEEHRYWEVEQWISGRNQEVLSRDPWQFRVSFRAGEDVCEVIMNEELEVVDYTECCDTV